ncbi:hypothetical protein Y1Q_0004092 [Alligator mississippiensis]|uniref:Uncharacterized protein n=1 Tax=Alligator mississippiensis TaxID=8496 RepID=A0A151PIB3_ALLMI|nr:hypothetical protein Y1Q_0004092 [Alligator mississippiensis]
MKTFCCIWRQDALLEGVVYLDLDSTVWLPGEWWNLDITEHENIVFDLNDVLVESRNLYDFSECRHLLLLELCGETDWLKTSECQ